MTPVYPPDGVRLPAATRIGLVCLQVSDLPRSIDFYTQVLGFAVLDRDADRARLGVAPGVWIELRAGARGPRIERRLGLYHFAILLPDRPALGRCLAHLVATGIRPGASDHLVSEALYLQDPDNLGIEIYRDRPREEWRAAGDELAMASAPLDTEGVLRAAGGVAWTGMPPETRMGHIHLHVGDLAEAKAFYHAGIGFDLTVWSYPGALFMSAGGYHHHVAVNNWSGPSAVAPEPNEARLLWWDLELPAPEAVSEISNRLAEKGYAVAGEAVDGTLIRDPWGTPLRVRTPVGE